MLKSNGNGELWLAESFREKFVVMPWFQNLEPATQEDVKLQVDVFLTEFFENPESDELVEQFQNSGWFPKKRNGGDLRELIREFVEAYWRWREDQEKLALIQGVKQYRSLNQLQSSSSLASETGLVDVIAAKIREDDQFKRLSQDQQNAILKKVPDFATRDWVSRFDEGEQYDIVWVLLQHEILKVGLAHPEPSTFGFPRPR